MNANLAQTMTRGGQTGLVAIQRARVGRLAWSKRKTQTGKFDRVHPTAGASSHCSIIVSAKVSIFDGYCEIEHGLIDRL